MWIEFVVEDDHKRLLGLPEGKRLPMVQGLPLLEEANREMIATNQQVPVDYLIYIDRNQELATLEATLTLPVEGQTVSEAIQAPVRDNEEVDSEDARVFLALFEKSLPKNKRTQGIRKKKAETNPKQKKTSEEKNIQVLHTEEKRTVKLATFLKVMMAVFLLFIGGYIGKSIQSQPSNNSEIQEQLSDQLNNLEQQVQQKAKIDTFSRFFLTNYYTGTEEDEEVQEKIKRFVDEEALDEFRGNDEQVKSILPWEVRCNDSTWHVSYVITLQNAQEKTTTQLVTFSLQAQEKQYKVLTVPKEENFDINQ